MPTPIFLTGFEHGIVVTGATPTPNERIWHTVATTGGTPGIDTTTPKSGARCLNIPATSGAGSYVSRNLSGTQTTLVAGFYVRFVGSLPTADSVLFMPDTGTGTFPSLWFNASDSKLYARAGTNLGASGFAVSADTWYRIDFKSVAAATQTCDVQVDGTALGQASVASAATDYTLFRIGKNVDDGTTANGNIRYDDLVISVTSGDYPLGDHEVLKLALDSDGTHSFTAGDFVYGDAGGNVSTSATDVWSNLDEVPFGAIGTTDSIQQNVIRTTGYVEVNFEASPRTVDAWGVQIFGQFDADATGADTSGMRLWDGTTEVTLYAPPNGDVSNTTATYLTFCRATNPSGGAWTQTAIGNLRARWGFSGDVTGSPIIHALMAEVAFPVTAGGGGNTPYYYAQVSELQGAA